MFVCGAAARDRWQDRNAGERSMWETARAQLREWYIVIVGVALIAGGFFLASHQPSSTAPSSTALSSAAPSAIAQSDKSPPSQPAQVSQPAHSAGPSATSTPSEHLPSPAPSAPADREAAADTVAQAAHEHGMAQTMSHENCMQHMAGHENCTTNMMAAADAQTNTPAQPIAAAAPPAGGDPAAGRLAFRKCQACHSMGARQSDSRPFARRSHRTQSRVRSRL
jgi:nitrite reductase (NO-forming)